MADEPCSVITDLWVSPIPKYIMGGWIILPRPSVMSRRGVGSLHLVKGSENDPELPLHVIADALRAYWRRTGRVALHLPYTAPWPLEKPIREIVVALSVGYWGKYPTSGWPFFWRLRVTLRNRFLDSVSHH
jgi:hypothetical protein